MLSRIVSASIIFLTLVSCGSDAASENETEDRGKAIADKVYRDRVQQTARDTLSPKKLEVLRAEALTLDVPKDAPLNRKVEAIVAFLHGIDDYKAQLIAELSILTQSEKEKYASQLKSLYVLYNLNDLVMIKTIPGKDASDPTQVFYYYKNRLVAAYDGERPDAYAADDSNLFLYQQGIWLNTSNGSTKAKAIALYKDGVLVRKIHLGN